MSMDILIAEILDAMSLGNVAGPPSSLLVNRVTEELRRKSNEYLRKPLVPLQKLVQKAIAGDALTETQARIIAKSLTTPAATALYGYGQAEAQQ